MHLIINEHKRIIGSANYAIDETELAKRNETVVYIDDYFYKQDMVGCLYIDSEPYYVKAPTQFHVIENGQHVLPSDAAEKCWEQVRQTRNQLLSLTDWTQLSDVKLSEADTQQYLTIRQELRDITKIQDPFNALNALKSYAFSVKGVRSVQV